MATEFGGARNVPQRSLLLAAAMSYRLLKKVLGETSLERKCRLLFGGCLLVLVGAAFWSVDRVAENLIAEKTQSQGRDWVNVDLFNRHWAWWVRSDLEGVDPNAMDADILARQGLQKELSRELLTENLSSRILMLPGNAHTFLPDAEVPANENELDLLRQIEAEWKQQNANLNEQKKTGAAGSVEPKASTLIPNPKAESPESRGAAEPVFKVAMSSDSNDYVYYQPLYWTKGCVRCHSLLPSAGVSHAERLDASSPQTPPFRVIEVTLPYEEIQSAVSRTRAIMIAVAIFTVFLAMMALYGIVRYVIVKPLQHLRDVSDNISRGQMDLRADIHTGDEFESLADSFNRMVRHLIESQANLRKVNAELDFKVDELAQLNMRLYDANRLKGEFLANMSHELRTPLNSIIGFSEVLAGIDSLTDKQRRYAQNIQKSGRLLLEMINDILDIAKVEAGKMDVKLAEFSIEAIVGAQCDMVRSLTEEKNIDLAIRVQAELPLMFQDQGKVQQILTNLLSNAIKFTPEGGRITVTAVQDDRERLDLAVADTGVGIAPQDREIIFEKFRQGTTVVGKDGLTRQYSGTGLGLSIVRELCKLLGGEVSVESEVGKGSTFRVLLPWSRAATPNSDAATLRTAEIPANTWDANKAEPSVSASTR